MKQIGPGDYHVAKGASVSITIDPRDGAAALVRAVHNTKALTNVGSAARPRFQFNIQSAKGKRDRVTVWYTFPAGTPAGAHFVVTIKSDGTTHRDRPITNRDANSLEIVRRPSYLFKAV